MARSVYLTGLEAGGGKSTVALGVAELLSRRVQRLGAFRPLVHDDGDPIVELLRGRYRTPSDAPGHGATYAEAAALTGAGRTDELVGRVLERYHALAARCDAVVVVGTDFGGEGDESALPEELAFNARLATEFGSILLPVVDGYGRGADAVAAAVRQAYHALQDNDVAAVVVNRVDPDLRAAALAASADLPVPVYAVPAVAAVSAPTVAEVAEALHATRLIGEGPGYDRDVLHFVVGAAQVPVFLDHLDEGCMVITPGDRADLVTATFAAHAAGLVSVAGVVVTLGERPDGRVLDLLHRLSPDLPVLLVDRDSFETVAACSELEGRITPDTPRKADAALGAFESNVDTAALAARLDVVGSTRVTPMMFEYALIERARRQRRHVVLPEGTEERILRATEVLLRRGVAELTLLGDPAAVARRARELGLDVSDAHVVDPVSSPWREEFADEYAKLRDHRGVLYAAAYDRVADVNYFGTLMVHRGRADAMVSGATHPTADTIRPAFEIIRTVPGVSIASSVFFMCLADRVLVYGDCAINPDPTAGQPATIAISSA